MESDQGVITYFYLWVLIIMGSGVLLTLAIQRFMGYKDGTRRIGQGAGLVIAGLVLLWVAWFLWGGVGF